MSRQPVPKTYKLFINGAFPRSERGRVLPLCNDEGKVIANYSWATRKDFRNAVVAARQAQDSWARRSAFNRGLILYRMAELLEDRRGLFVQKLIDHAGDSAENAQQLLSTTIDRLFFYAGWADKYAQVVSSVNPVAGPFFNFTFPEPTGVVSIVAPTHSPLLGLVCAIAPIILSGNCVIVIVENNAPTIAIDLAELLATSDLPAGVINILTGQRAELLKPMAGHKDVNAIAYYGTDSAEIITIQTDSAENVKRFQSYFQQTDEEWMATPPSLYTILPFVEYKTAWHPMGM